MKTRLFVSNVLGLFAVIFILSSVFGDPPHPLPQDIQYRKSVEFAAIATEVYRMAFHSISEQLKSASAPDKWAIIMDVDETVLDNTEYQIQENDAFDEKAWEAWIQSKKSGVVPGAKEFLDQVRKLKGAHIVFITDRSTDQEEATVENLKALGLFKEGDQILTKIDKSDNKGVRRECVELGLDDRCQPNGPLPIIALFGDSARDFEEYYGNAMKTEGCKHILANAGKKYWVIPNPMYGQWQRDYN